MDCRIRNIGNALVGLCGGVALSVYTCRQCATRRLASAATFGAVQQHVPARGFPTATRPAYELTPGTDVRASATICYRAPLPIDPAVKCTHLSDDNPPGRHDYRQPPVFLILTARNYSGPAPVDSPLPERFHPPGLLQNTSQAPVAE